MVHLDLALEYAYLSSRSACFGSRFQATNCDQPVPVPIAEPSCIPSYLLNHRGRRPHIRLEAH